MFSFQHGFVSYMLRMQTFPEQPLRVIGHVGSRMNSTAWSEKQENPSCGPCGRQPLSFPQQMCSVTWAFPFMNKSQSPVTVARAFSCFRDSPSARSKPRGSASLSSCRAAHAFLPSLTHAPLLPTPACTLLTFSASELHCVWGQMWCVCVCKLSLFGKIRVLECF